MTEESKGPNKNNRRFVRTEKAIRSAFFRLAEQLDIQKITISALAREADIDRKTFYLHYDSVDMLIDELMNEEALLLVDQLRKSVSDNNSDMTVDFLQELSVGLAVDMKSIRRMAAHMSIESQLQRIEQPLIEAIVADNSFNFDNEVANADYYISFLTAGMLAVYRRWLLEDSDIPLDNISKVARTFIQAAYGATGGART
jgi:AcrR family transcriptional regulator